ncbi:HAMP domain-containing sensor histidine kinase [Metasolibacillus sp. FSL H7-0170]|uniref:sensor histidine kinase n=1 Tax=Metasolibacillus TaxID=2703677 RepID=UPI00079BB32F|nr:HAMP domain-containing sensor histidine kinase [Metasolibacillus fluoroglycofenilyticus]KYG90902.1 vancomycin resistance histidine kinase VanS [[Bacillus] sp. KCTC 13219]
MIKRFHNFRVQMAFLFAVSMAFSGAITGVIFSILRWYYKQNVYADTSLADLRQNLRAFGDTNAFLVVFALLSFLIFMLLTKKYTGYFQTISTGIRHLADGDFSQKIHIQSRNEFGEVAEHINIAAKMLQEAIERGDFSESSKNELIVNLAHDLRTPLTSVLGYLYLILHDENLTEEQKKHFLTIAYTKAGRLEGLIDTLFEVTRLNYGMLPLKQTAFDIGHLLLQLAEEMYPIVEQANLITRTEIEDNLMVYADGELLARVFENLITNACRYGVDGQYIDITAKTVDDSLEIRICNYGSMIPEKDLPYLFDMFYTADKSRSSEHNSTGLGLFIAKNIVEQHEGTISATSSLKETCFIINLRKI